MIMHELHLYAALLAAVENGRVLIVADQHQSIREIMSGLLDASDGWQEGLVKKVTRLNGGERIDLATGGSIRFALASRVRRRDVFDQAFVPIGTGKEFLAELAPALADSRDGLITGY